MSSTVVIEGLNSAGGRAEIVLGASGGRQVAVVARVLGDLDVPHAIERRVVIAQGKGQLVASVRGVHIH